MFRQLTRPGVIRFFLEKTWGSKQIDEALFQYDIITTRQPGAKHAPLYFLSALLFSADIMHVYDALNVPTWLVHVVRRSHGGKASDVRRFVDALARVGPRAGIYINRAKCEVVAAPGVDVAALFPEFHVQSVEKWSLLGAPCGTDVDGILHHVAEAVVRAEDRNRAIALVGELHPAFALMRYCGGFSLLVHLLR